MECGIRLAVPAMSSWIVRRDGDGSLRVLAEANMTGWSWIEDGTLYGEPTDAREYRLGRMAAVRWNGCALVPVDTSARYPAMRSLDLSRVVAALPCHDLSAPDTLHLDFDPHLNAVGGAWLWSLDPAGWGSFWEQLGRTGRPYLVTDINCAPLRSSAEWNRRLVVLDLLPEGWAALAVLEPGPVQQWDLQRIDGRTVTLRQIEVSGEDHLVAYLWDGTRFLRQA
jgi:hypothetical protein